MKVSVLCGLKSITALALIALASLIALALLADVRSASAQSQWQTTPTPTPTSGPNAGEFQPAPYAIKGKVNPPKYPNMDSTLNRLVESVQQGISSVASAAAKTEFHSGESVAVTLYLSEGFAEPVQDFLNQNGGDVRNSGDDYIEAYAPLTLLPQASELAGVLRIQPIMSSDDDQNVVISGGVAAHNASAWHSAGYRGEGVKVGVIDAGDDFRGFRSLMGTELPSEVRARCYPDIGVVTDNLEDCMTDSDHGTRVTEVLFDIAPNATYYIASPSSLWGADMHDSVEWMVSEGVDVIGMSSGTVWDGPGDGTSPFSVSPLNAVDKAVRGGAIWTNSAGSDARAVWFGEFNDPDGDGRHNFNGADECNGLELDGGDELRVQLRWDDIWLGASRDLDMLLWSESNQAYVATSEYPQSGGLEHIPFEHIRYDAASGGQYCLEIKHISGARPDWIQMLIRRPGTDLEHFTMNGSIRNPAESRNPGMLAVGGAPWSNTDTIYYYGSRGPTPDGRVKPDIIGANGVRTATDDHFGGTSSAQPHIAGLAALVRQRFPHFTPQQTAQYLKDNADPRGEVPNNTWGYGFAKLPDIDTATPVTGGDTQSRLSELERQTGMLQRLIQNLQALIQALTARMDALDGGTAPVVTPPPTPTRTPTATPSPTPTSVAGTDPTPVTTPTTDSACIQNIEQDSLIAGISIAGTWTTDCLTANPDPTGTYYAKFYTFTLDSQEELEIRITSDYRPYFYLTTGEGTAREILHYGRIASGELSQFLLQPGSYTMEVTTYSSGVTGDFDLWMGLRR